MPQPFRAADIDRHRALASPPAQVQYPLSRIKSARSARASYPVLSVSRNDEDYDLTLSFDEQRLSMAMAMSLLNDLADRLERPLRHLI